jgi:hypothetical protein
LLAKYVASDLIGQREKGNSDEAQLALKCFKAAVKGKKLTCPELIRLASALGIGTEELKAALENLRTKNGAT